MSVILFADNVPEFLDTRAEFLEALGHKVLKAYTLEQAYQILREAHVQLAILDLRLVDDDDDHDTSGLTLAKDPDFRLVPKIVLTGFASYTAVRQALGPTADGLPPAVDFLSKEEGPDAMIEAVAQALDEYVGTSSALQMDWGQQQPLSFLFLASLLQPSESSDLLVQRAGELEDLFCRLFRNYRQVRVGQLLWHADNRSCLSVLAQSPRGAVNTQILVCGEPHSLRLEMDRVRELAPSFGQGVRPAGWAETMRFGAILYDLADANAHSIEPMANLIQVGRRRQLKAAVDHLLSVTLPSWHKRGHCTVDTDDLMALYRQKAGLTRDGLSQPEVEQRVAALAQALRPLTAVEIEYSAGYITFYFPPGRREVYPDPVAIVYQEPEWHQAPTVCKVSPGHLTAQNILVDADQCPWLTDFSQAGQAPQWWDYVCLEAIVRFDIGQAPDMLALQEFEECLVKSSDLHQHMREQEVMGDLQTNVALIEQVRRQAGSETGPDPLPYYAGLLVWAVGAMSQYTPQSLYTMAEQMRGAHLLLSAAMLARRLEELIEARDRPLDTQTTGTYKEETDTLKLGEDGVKVWIGEERSVDLTGQEQELFRCLYEQSGRLVPRHALIEQVFEEPYDATDKYQARRLNSLVRRLREKIEPYPSKPRYIFTVRGQGYRLDKGKGASSR